mgnify:CR=1 FL=1
MVTVPLAATPDIARVRQQTGAIKDSGRTRITIVPKSRAAPNTRMYQMMALTWAARTGSEAAPPGK